jgi:hypothetical protein
MMFKNVTKSSFRRVFRLFTEEMNLLGSNVYNLAPNSLTQVYYAKPLH